MRTTAILLACVLLLPAAASARDVGKAKARDEVQSTVDGIADCVTAGYEVYEWTAGTAVPDDDPDGVTVGPLPTAGGSTMLDVILKLDIEHTWIGDLIVELWYDGDCDGEPETFGGVLCRHDLAGCPTTGCCGCGGNLLGWYGFDDTIASIEDECFAEFPPGCYGPDYDSAGLDVFDGLPTGGCFWLHVADCAGGDVGQIRQWRVSLMTEPYSEVYGAFDVKPGSCPNPLNVNSHGVLPAAFLGTESFDVSMIDPSTIRLLGSVEPVRWDYEDVATPVGPDAEPCECNELGPDGYGDLTVKFLKQSVVEAIGIWEDGDVISLPVTATLTDGTEIALNDCVWIIDNTRQGTRIALQAPGTGEALKQASATVRWGTIKALYR
jgi:hypothetical protein